MSKPVQQDAVFWARQSDEKNRLFMTAET